MTDTSQSLLTTFLSDNKKDHYNFEDSIDYKVSSGSMLLDVQLGGGFGPGLHRFVGFTEGGKTSAALEVMRNFLKGKNRRGFYVKAEGRLTPEMMRRSGVKFVTTADAWVDGTCFVFESNIYETCAEIILKLVTEKTSSQFCFILDSVDGLISKGDLTKNLEESNKVAGGAVIASNLMKRISIPLAKRGHMAIFISQVRADIKLDPYTKVPVRQTSATGGNALLHFPNWVLEFEPRFKGDIITANPNVKEINTENPPIGHWAKVTVKKSPNEKTNMAIKYPIKYGQTDGKSIWRSKEVVDSLIMWELIEQRGAWFFFHDELCELLGVENGTKFQGGKQLADFFEENEGKVELVHNYLTKMVNGCDLIL